MGEHDANNAIGLLGEVREIRPQDINAPIIAREGCAAIDQQNAVRLFDGEAILSNFAEATQGDHANRLGIKVFQHEPLLCPRHQDLASPIRAENRQSIPFAAVQPVGEGARPGHANSPLANSAPIPQKIGAMSQSTTATPDEALNLTKEGFTYVDVRNQVEFEQGHPAGSYNIPFILQTDFGPEPNEKFVQTLTRLFGRDAKLVIGCAMGGRSAKAVKLLTDAGFTNLVDQKAGFNGWRGAGLPIELGQPDGRSYEELVPED